MFDLLQGFRVAMPMASVEDFIHSTTILLIFVGVPTIAIVTYHQRKMAEIKARRQPQQIDQTAQRQISALEAKVDNLTMIVQEHIIDNDRSQASVEQRLNH